MIKIAVIGLQGDVGEHIAATNAAMKKLKLDGTAIWARNIGEVKGASGIILPGGESTTIGKLALANGIREEIIKLAHKGIPILTTCAGTILLSKKAANDKSNESARLLKLLDIEVDRNAFGTQRDSFEAEIDFQGIGKFNAIFIRAPIITKINDDSKIIAKFENKIAGIEKGNIIAVCFHPELADDTRIHEYFLKKCMKSKLN